MKWYLVFQYGGIGAPLKTLPFGSKEEAERFLKGMRMFDLFGVTRTDIVDEAGLERIRIELEIQTD